jgi:hypothetical protein
MAEGSARCHFSLSRLGLGGGQRRAQSLLATSAKRAGPASKAGFAPVPVPAIKAKQAGGRTIGHVVLGARSHRGQQAPPTTWRWLLRVRGLVPASRTSAVVKRKAARVDDRADAALALDFSASEA